MLSEMAQVMCKAQRVGAVGPVQFFYPAFGEGMAHRMNPTRWTTASGAHYDQIQLPSRHLQGLPLKAAIFYTDKHIGGIFQHRSARNVLLVKFSTKIVLNVLKFSVAAASHIRRVFFVLEAHKIRHLLDHSGKSPGNSGLKSDP